MKHFKVYEHTHHVHVGFLAYESANALSLSAARQLDSLQKQLKGVDKPIVFSSAHPTVFCSGGNLSDYKKLKSAAAGLKVNREITQILDRFQAWPVPKLAVIEGDVLGGGMEWLARFDFRWATPASMFSFWQRRIGLSTGWGGGKAWTDRIGPDKLRTLLLEARLLNAFEAQRIGLIDQVVSPWRVADESLVWARHMSESTVRPLLGWKAKSEAKFFSKLWMGPLHKRALERWKG